MKNKKVRVDCEQKVVWIKQRKYWFKENDSDEEDEVRMWYTHSKQIFEDEDGEKVRLTGIRSNFDPEPEGLEQVAIRVRKPKTLKFLNSILDRAAANSHRRKLKEKRGVSNHDKEEQQDSENEEKADRNMEESVSHRPSATVNVRLKSEISNFELNLRAAPSKKNKGLYNFSVHLGSQLKGYVEVKRNKIIGLGRQLQNLANAQLNDEEAEQEEDQEEDQGEVGEYGWPL